MKIITLNFLLLFSLLAVQGAYAEPSSEGVQMQLSWRHQFQFAGYYAAVEKGFYKEVGLNVELLEGGEGVHCDQATLERVAFCNASGSIVKERIEGQPLVALASIIQHSPIILLTQKDSGLLTPHDLAGKRVEMLLAGKPIPEILAMLNYEGVSLSSLSAQENTVGIDQFFFSEVDAKYVFSSNEPHLLDQMGVTYNIINPRQYGVDFYGDVLLTSEHEVQDNPEKVQGFLKASLKGWEYAMANQQEIVDLIVKKYKPIKSRQALLAEAKSLEKLILPDLIKIGHMNIGRWTHTADTLVSMGLVRSDYSLKGFLYEPKAKNYLELVRWLTGGLVISGWIVFVLGLFNRRLSREVNERIKAQERLRLAKEEAMRQAYTDELSGMGNRRAFYEQGIAAITLAKKDKENLSLIMLDIDHFKSINDNYGHLIGDQAIQVVAQVILNTVRSQDVAGRVGGEEFSVILPRTDLQGGLDLAERVRVAIAKTPFLIQGKTVPVTASCGVATLHHDDDINRLVQRADEAMYQAKQQGRNRVMSL